MTDKIDMTPELTLDPTGAAQAAQAEAVLPTPEAPTLTLEPTLGAEETAAVQAQRDANAVKVDESMLTEAERKMVDDFSQKIDITDSNMVLQYGAAAQKNVASFSESALKSVRTKDLGEVGDTLSDLVVELKGFDEEEEEGGIFGFFKSKRNELEEMKVRLLPRPRPMWTRLLQILEDHQVTADEGHRHVGPDV